MSQAEMRLNSKFGFSDLVIYRCNQGRNRLITNSRKSSHTRCLCHHRLASLTRVSQRSTHLMFLFAFATVLLVRNAFALCASTTENLLRVEIYACQPIVVGASVSKSDTHAIHKPGARMKGTLVTGKVVASDSVWMAEWVDDDSYVMEVPIVPAGTVASFFVAGSSGRNCDDTVGTVLVFVTDRPCCDVIPASGICLIPESITIVREEHVPERWSKWPKESTDN